MSNDLLFSILPREGKVPIAHDSQKVVKIDKQEELRALTDEEKELKNEEKEARKKQQQRKEKEKEQNSKQGSSSDPITPEDSEQKKPKGPKHLDIYV